MSCAVGRAGPRNGFVTTAGRNDVPELAIIRQTGHHSLKTLAAYMREEGAVLEQRGE